MILCIDIGNTHIFGGVYKDKQLALQVRHPSTTPVTSDQLGIFFKTVLRENDLDPQAIKQIAVCSVVPALDYSLRSACVKYFALEPFFLNGESAHHLHIDYKNPQEVGADRLSNAIAAIHLHPDKNIIVIDLGTATTFDVIRAGKHYLGGVIMAGVQTAMSALHENTAKLFPVNIVKPNTILGQNTLASIQSGLYYSHLGAMHEIIDQLTRSVFHGETPIILGTGGFAYLFAEENIFHSIIPELVLQGLQIAVSSSH